jgi:hypothetical protein
MYRYYRSSWGNNRPVVYETLDPQKALGIFADYLPQN